MRPTYILAALALAVAPAVAQEAGKEAPAAEAKAPAPIKVSEFTFKPAAPWKTAETAPMSAGTVEIESADGKATVNFFTFGAGQGGDVQQNIQRWRGMFKKGDDGALQAGTPEEWVFGERKVQTVMVKGTYTGSSFRPVGPFENYALIGVVVESTEGSVFVRAVGPEKAMTAAREELKKLIGSAFAK